jgi:hypothetical protein
VFARILPRATFQTAFTIRGLCLFGDLV